VRKISSPHGGGGHAKHLLRLIAQPEPFVIGHEEQAVSAIEDFWNLDRTAQCKAELVPLKRRGGGHAAREGVGTGVESAVAKKLKHRAVVSIRSAPSRDVDLGGFTPEFGGIDAGLHLEFLQSVDGGEECVGVKVDV